jgi:hypothetical protein
VLSRVKALPLALFSSQPEHPPTKRQRGLVPDDIDLDGGLVADISYRNAREYFGFTAAGDSQVKT